MIVSDTSALISLASLNILDLCLTEFETHTTDTVRQELEETSEYEDSHANAADTVLENIDRIAIHHPDQAHVRVNRAETALLFPNWSTVKVDAIVGKFP